MEAFYGRGLIAEGTNFCLLIKKTELHQGSWPEKENLEKIDTILGWINAERKIPMKWPIGNGNVENFNDYMFNLSLLPDIDADDCLVSFTDGHTGNKRHCIMVVHFTNHWILLSSRDDEGTGHNLMGSLA